MKHFDCSCQQMRGMSRGTGVGVRHLGSCVSCTDSPPSSEPSRMADAMQSKESAVCGSLHSAVPGRRPAGPGGPGPEPRSESFQDSSAALRDARRDPHTRSHALGAAQAAKQRTKLRAKPLEVGASGAAKASCRSRNTSPVKKPQLRRRSPEHVISKSNQTSLRL